MYLDKLTAEEVMSIVIFLLVSHIFSACMLVGYE